jgi:hypothetical protein
MHNANIIGIPTNMANAENHILYSSIGIAINVSPTKIIYPKQQNAQLPELLIFCFMFCVSNY